MGHLNIRWRFCSPRYHWVRDITLSSDAVADPRGASPARAPHRLRTKIFLISCSFWENQANLYVGAPGLAPPPAGNPVSAPVMPTTWNDHDLYIYLKRLFVSLISQFWKNNKKCRYCSCKLKLQELNYSFKMIMFSLLIQIKLLIIGGSREAPGTPPGSPNSFIFIQFSAKFSKILAILGVGAPPWGKSWIRHCS